MEGGPEVEGIASGPSGRPRNFVAGVIGDRNEFERALDELVAAGVPREGIGVLQGERGADAITGRHGSGIRGWFGRAAEALSDESTYVDRYAEEARKGGFVVGVPLPDGSDATRKRIHDILESHGARHIVSSTRFTHAVEE